METVINDKTVGEGTLCLHLGVFGTGDFFEVNKITYVKISWLMAYGFEFHRNEKFKLG